MKQLFLCLFILSLCGCTKDNSPSLIGKWKLREIYDCTSGNQINVNRLLIEFSSNGAFKMDTTSGYSDLKYVLKNLDRYSKRNDGSIKFYNDNLLDSVILSFYLESELVLSSRFGGYKFISH